MVNTVLKYWIGAALGILALASVATMAAKTGEVWLSCYATAKRVDTELMQAERWTMTFKCGKGDISNVVADLR